MRQQPRANAFPARLRARRDPEGRKRLTNRGSRRPIALQIQRVCHDTLPWLISVSLDLMALILSFPRFPTFIEARKAFRARPCIYVQTDREENLLRIGECDDIWARYRSGTAYTLDAAGHGAGNLLRADARRDRKERCRLEATLIYALKQRYNNQHMKRSLNPAEYSFAGDIPRGLSVSR